MFELLLIREAGPEAGGDQDQRKFNTGYPRVSEAYKKFGQRNDFLHHHTYIKFYRCVLEGLVAFALSSVRSKT